PPTSRCPGPPRSSSPSPTPRPGSPDPTNTLSCRGRSLRRGEQCAYLHRGGCRTGERRFSIMGTAIRRMAGRGVILACGVVLSVAAQADAQEPGVIEGRAIAATGASLQDVDVFLTGAGRRALTNRDGRFRIAAVAPGTYDLVAERVGYATERREVTVRPGEAAMVS